MKFNDILGIGKVLPLDKLLEIVNKVTGRLTKQYFDKKDIDTKAYEIKTLAQARAEEMKIITDAVKENFSGTGGITPLLVFSSHQQHEKQTHRDKIKLRKC